MEMLLRHTTMNELAGILHRHRRKSSIDYLRDGAIRKRARRLAKRNGQWETIQRDLDPEAVIPVIRRSDFRRFQRTGNRTVHQNRSAERLTAFRQAVLALWLGHPQAHVDHLEDLLWAICDEHTWIMAAHEGGAIDLGSAMLGAELAETIEVFRDSLEDEVVDRVRARIEERIFRAYLDPDRVDGWRTQEMNWNHVCNGSILRTALLLIEDARLLARLAHRLVNDMTYALDGFTDDGGCEEGPGYWGFGFGHFVLAADALYRRTGGRINLMTNEKIARICRFPLATHIGGELRATFSDSAHGWVSPTTALLVNRYHEVPELYALCRQHDDGTLRLGDLRALALYGGEKAPPMPAREDHVLPDLGFANLHGGTEAAPLQLLVKVGHNDQPHNHNDIGSFQLVKNGRILLDDPGAPLYTRKTFSPQRYEILHCRSRGHSVPLIGGTEQAPGRRYRGTLRVEGANGDGARTAVVEMAKAYPKGTVRRLTRTFYIAPGSSEVRMEDAIDFGGAPKGIEEAFVTYETATLERGGKAVRVGPKRSGLTLTCEATGTWKVDRLVEESAEGRSPGQVITRITFVPSRRRKEETLAFRMR